MIPLLDLGPSNSEATKYAPRTLSFEETKTAEVAASVLSTKVKL
jgi:hypothetical protein